MTIMASVKSYQLLISEGEQYVIICCAVAPYPNDISMSSPCFNHLDWEESSTPDYTWYSAGNLANTESTYLSNFYQVSIYNKSQKTNTSLNLIRWDLTVHTHLYMDLRLDTYILSVLSKLSDTAHTRSKYQVYCLHAISLCPSFYFLPNQDDIPQHNDAQ